MLKVVKKHKKYKHFCPKVIDPFRLYDIKIMRIQEIGNLTLGHLKRDTLAHWIRYS
jgi:hypothetical protein